MSDPAQIKAWLHEEFLSGRDPQRAADALLFVNRTQAKVERLTADPRMALTEADLRKVLELAWGSRLNPPKGAWERVEKVRAALREEGTK
jgi:hypothetical protein